MTSELPPPRGPFPPQTPPAPQGPPPPQRSATPPRNPALDETVILTPVVERTDALNRIPVSERRKWRILAAVAGGVAVVATVLAVVFGVTGSSAATNAAAEQARAEGLAADLAEEQALVVSQQQELDDLRARLTAAEQSVLDLTDLNAESGSAVETAQQTLAELEQITTLAGATGTAMQRCVDAQDTLVVYLKHPDDYTASSVKNYEKQVDALCAAAEDANDTLHEILSSR